MSSVLLSKVPSCIWILKKKINMAWFFFTLLFIKNKAGILSRHVVKNWIQNEVQLLDLWEALLSTGFGFVGKLKVSSA